MGPKSKSKTKSGNTIVQEIVIPELTLVTPALEGTDPTVLPFQEWLDLDVNAENWEGIGPVKDKTAKEELEVPEKVELFKDPQVVYLPNSIVVQRWKRPAEVYPDVNFIIYEEKPEYPDLISGSKHLLHSEFVRSFISSIQTLLYLGNTSQFNIEYISPSYTPTTENIPWRPWHHIYSNCMAGKGQDHLPTVNKIGKYIVRLFWMGSWRQIYVDDLLPVDLLDHVLLPSLELTKDELALRKPQEEEPPSGEDAKIPEVPDKKKEKRSVQIWPFILSKALLKIASLSWYDTREALDFDCIQCFTGWIPQMFNTKGLDIDSIWDICAAYTNHFCWPPEKSEASTKASKGGKKDKKKGLISMENDFNAHHLMACCNDLRDFAEDEILDISPCWSHFFLIDQTRDIPLLKPTITAELAFWKRFRWLAWKIEKGLVPAEELRERIRCFKLVSPFKKVYEHVVYKQPSKIALDIETTVNIITEEVKKGKGKGKGKGDAGGKGKGKGKEKAQKGGKGKKGKPKKIDTSLIPNPSLWVDFEQISGQINAMRIYLKPSRFKTKYAVSDLALNKISKDVKPATGKAGSQPTPDWKYCVHPKNLMPCRNEPIYFFTDSIDYKLIVVNLVQEGYTAILKEEEEPPAPTTNDITECDFCVSALVQRIKRNITNSEVKKFISINLAEARPIIHARPKSNLALEEYDWQTEHSGKLLCTISTYGSKTVNLDLTPGRHLFKLWISSETSYVVHILSDSAIVAGCLEGLLYQMSQESQLLINMCVEISSTFGKLVQAFGMPEFSIQLKSFYSSYKPENNLTKVELVTLHDTFYNLLYYAVEQSLTKAEMRAMGILFFRWQFPMNVHYVDELELCTCHEYEDVYFVKTLQWYTVRIQAFFRGIYERGMLKRHNPEHKEHLAIFGKLKNIYDAIFSAQKRLLTCPTLLRVFLNHPLMAEIRSKYRISYDIENVLTLHESEQSVKFPDNDWGLISRQQFFINSPRAVLVKISLFCNLNNYFVRVFNNDTKEEMKRYTNTVKVTKYEANVYGYTILCYGFSSESKTLLYKLSFAKQKNVIGDDLIVSSRPPIIEFFKGNYIPNVNNYICRYLVHVYSNTALLTVRFSPCYSNAIVNLKLMDDFGIVLQEVTGSKHIILPAVMLEHAENPKTSKPPSENSVKDKKSKVTLTTSSSKSFDKASKKSDRSNLKSRSMTSSRKSIQEQDETIFVIEATVVGDSWPLSADEWKNVDALKADMLYEPFLKDTPSGLIRQISSVRSNDPKKRNSIRRIEPLVLEPYWVLQTICNTTDVVQFSKCTRREDEIKNMKSKWYEDDPMRYQTSKELRQMFLNERHVGNYNLPENANLPHARSLSSNFFAAEILPPHDLTDYYMIKDLESVEGIDDTRTLKTENDFENDLNEEFRILEEFQLTHVKLIGEMDSYVLGQMNTFELLNNWFEECRSESVEMMNDALNLKNEYVKNVLESLDPGKGKKEKGGKAKKKK